MTRFTNPLDIPLAGEAGASLGHAGRRLRKTLDALSHYDDAVSTERRQPIATERNALIAEAGDTLWSYVVHREILGLMDADYIFREYRVPDEVRRSMAPRRRKRS